MNDDPIADYTSIEKLLRTNHFLCGPLNKLVLIFITVVCAYGHIFIMQINAYYRVYVDVRFLYFNIETCLYVYDMCRVYLVCAGNAYIHISLDYLHDYYCYSV